MENSSINKISILCGIYLLVAVTSKRAPRRCWQRVVARLRLREFMLYCVRNFMRRKSPLATGFICSLKKVITRCAWPCEFIAYQRRAITDFVQSSRACSARTAQLLNRMNNLHALRARLSARMNDTRDVSLFGMKSIIMYVSWPVRSKSNMYVYVPQTWASVLFGIHVIRRQIRLWFISAHSSVD